MTDLIEQKCQACQVGSTPVAKNEQMILLNELPEWQVVVKKGVEQLLKTYSFKDFRQAMEFSQHIAELAELEHHHPAILTEWGRVTLRWWTHKINGLHQNDFIMAAKSDSEYLKRVTEARANI